MLLFGTFGPEYYYTIITMYMLVLRSRKPNQTSVTSPPTQKENTRKWMVLNSKRRFSRGLPQNGTWNYHYVVYSTVVRVPCICENKDTGSYKVMCVSFVVAVFLPQAKWRSHRTHCYAPDAGAALQHLR